MNKQGFTLAEVLIMMVLVGVISVLSIQTVKTEKTKFGFSCYHFFKDLKTTVGHMGSSTIGGTLNSFSCEKAADVSTAEYTACLAAGNNTGSTEPEEGEEEGEGESGTPITSDYLLDYRTGEGFCKGIAQYLGTASKIECDAAKLNNATLSNVYGSISLGQAENFRLMNGYLIYISNRIAVPLSNTAYRILSVDLNGNSSPNKTDEDIISFAIYDNGEVLPLGEAAINPKFFNTVIKMRNILPVPAANQEAALKSARHPTAIIRNSSNKPLSFKDSYCRVLGSSPVDPNYCSGYTSFTEKFKLSQTSAGSAVTTEVPVTICSQAKYNADGSPAQTVNGQGFVAECEFNVIKPQVSKFIPVSQDVFSSRNNNEDSDEGTGEANQIYQY